MMRVLLLWIIVCSFGLKANEMVVNLKFDHQPTSPHFGELVLDLPYQIDATQLASVNIKWEMLLTLNVGAKDTVKVGYPSIVGDYSVVDGNLIFKPRFTLVPEQSYTAIFNALAFSQIFSGHPAFEQSRYQLSRYVKAVEFGEQTQVSQILPKVTAAPQNLLRFYVYFSQPMSYASPYPYLSVLDNQGRVVTDALVVFNQGLWDKQRTRLTVFIHPGRVKRGVGPNLKQGPVFTVGQQYQLKIDKRFKDANQRALKQDFYKTLTITDPIYHKINPDSWALDAPKANSRQSLVIKPNRVLDPVLALRLIKVVDLSNEVVKGELKLDELGLALLFKPVDKWKKGHYQIQLSNKLEDLAGNTPAWAFDSETPVKPSSDESRVFTVIFDVL